MTTRTLRIAMNGITGRMGYRQHLLRSILPIRDQGGFTLEDGTKVQVEPILIGRNEAKVSELAELHGVEHWTTDLDGAIADPTVDIVFDASRLLGPPSPALVPPTSPGTGLSDSGSSSAPQ